MQRTAVGFALALFAAASVRAGAAPPATRPASRIHVVVFDFDTSGVTDTGGPSTPLPKRPIGVRLADSVRLKLRRHAGYEVLDRLTTQETARPLGLQTDLPKIVNLMDDRLAVTMALYGTVKREGAVVEAKIRCIDRSRPGEPGGWTKTFRDDTERFAAVISRAVVEAIRGETEWTPPQYGDEEEPKEFGKPLNANGSFEAGSKGWERPDNVSTFIVDGPKGRGKILRVRTDLERDAWLAYTKALRLGQADPSRPPEIPRDKSYGSVAGLEGVHYRGDFVKAEPGRRYWLVVDCKGQGGAKVFVKGFRKTPAAMDGLPESALAELGLTPHRFADLPEAKRKELIAADARKHPQRYVRECYRWYLNCKDAKGHWLHLAAPFPPRGGLPDYVEYLQVQIYSYWPPGEYLWDNVHLYRDPRQEAPLPEVKPRTPNPPPR